MMRAHRVVHRMQQKKQPMYADLNHNIIQISLDHLINWENTLRNLPDFFRVFTLAMLCGTACADKAPEPAWSIENNITTIHAATKIVVAKLKPVSAENAHSTSLKSLDRMAGYPVTGNAVTSDKPSAQLKKLLLDERAYNNALIRCANTEFYGMRFLADNQFIEIAVGLPCNQIIWAYQRESQIERWGGILNKEIADEIISILKEKNGVSH